MTVQKQNAELNDLIAPTFQKRNEPNFAIANAIPSFQQIPGLRGLWCASLVDENLALRDLSLQGRTLSQTGTPTFSQAGLVPYVAYDGATQYHSRADEAGLDITGNITLGGWFYLTSTANLAVLMSKYDLTTNNRSFRLACEAGGAPSLTISVDGVAVWQYIPALTLPTNTWFFLCGRYYPGAQANILYNGELYTTIAGVPASIFNSNSPLMIGGYGAGTANFPGRMWMCFLSSASVLHTIMRNLYEQTRPAFGL